VCEGEKHYVPFCAPPTEFECDELPECAENCEFGDEECQRVFGCEVDGVFEAWIQLPFCEEEIEVSDCEIPKCFGCPSWLKPCNQLFWCEGRDEYIPIPDCAYYTGV